MRLSFLVPDLHDRPTGGNIYNRRIITELQRRGPVEVVPWSEETDSSSIPPNDVVLVDSLLVRHDEALRALREAHPDASLVLLTHYLHCIDPNEQDTPQAETEQALLPVFDGAITTSQYAKGALADAGMCPDRIRVVPPGIDDSYRAPITSPPPHDPPHLLTVSTLQPGKGLLHLVDQLESLEDLSWTWTLVGDDTLAPAFAATLRARVESSSVADRVTLSGPLSSDAVRTQYDRSDVFVLPSRFETCSMATREAMARGLPVVGYAVGGLPENFGDVEAGRLVSPEASEVFVDAIRSLLTHPEKRRRMGATARSRSRTFPTWAETADHFHSALASFRDGSG
jgi:glycosyltransferase involved in cell wall biosynthesis